MLVKRIERVDLCFESLADLYDSVILAMRKRQELNATASFDGGWDSGVEQVVLEYSTEETREEREGRLELEKARQDLKLRRRAEAKERLTRAYKKAGEALAEFEASET